MDRHGQPPPKSGGRPVTSKDVAIANENFDQFLNASSLKHILGYYRNICDFLSLKPSQFPLFYPKLKGFLGSWRAKALWKKFDARIGHKCYGKGKICANTRVLVIGGGPCGLRTAIEAQLLGAKVVVIEKRDRLSRNNVLHLWPFVIEDLRMLGAKKFFGKFCAGAIDHISIRQLQCILLKIALLLGVEVHTEVSFERLIDPDPTEKTGWRAEYLPSTHPVSQYEFDIIIGADGKRNTLQGFKRKEFRGKLAIAITANFINKRSEAEAVVEEISGVAFIFNQKFFKDLYEGTGIDLENIVYYKDETHYFVMTAKKPSLLEKGVIVQDLADTERLLAPDNVNREALMDYAKEAASFSTHYQMPNLEFAVNHYGQPDVAMFDFTSMYAAENASKVVERSGYRLLMILVGDSLLEPFWPTGSGCARGFLSSMDAAWAIRSWCLGNKNALDVIAERESIYRLLGQTTPDNLNKDWKAYTLDPSTRYPNLNKNVVVAHQTVALFDTDNPKSIERMRRNPQDVSEVPRKRRRGNVDNDVLLRWISEQVKEHEDIVVSDIASVFKDGKVLSAILSHYRPDLLDYNSLKSEEPQKRNQLVIELFEKEVGISPVMSGEEITETEDYLTMATYLTQIYDTFRCEIPHIKHPKIDLPDKKKGDSAFRSLKPLFPSHFTPKSQVTVHHPAPIRPSSRHKRHIDAASCTKQPTPDRKTRKRRTLDKMGATVEERQKVLEEIASNRYERQNKRRQQRKLQTEQFIKSMQMLQANAKSDHSQPFEDYSLFVYRQTAANFEDRVKDLEKKFTYVPDHENKPPNQTRGNTDEDFAARIKNLEDKWKDPQPVEKKPKDLLRAIGKIETSDWNIKEIEKKIRENKMGKTVNKDKEKVPKWSREQFVARQTKMEKQHLDRQDSAEAKFADIDKNIKHLELKLKEGTNRDLGQSKVASITEKLVSKVPESSELKPLQKSQSRPAVLLPPPNQSEFCHFCGKRVYLMERLSAEGRFFHHICFKCQYCNAQLRLGSYAYDKDGLYDHKFFCLHHYGMQAEPKSKIARKASQRKSPEKKHLGGIAGVDLLDRVRTPERVEFANLSVANPSDHEESLSQMDEDEWTDKNFGASTAELGSSDDESSSTSYTDSDDDAYEEALEEPATKEGTLKWAERFKKRYSKKRNDSESDDYSSSDSSYYENTSDDDDSDTATEGEEEIRARELRKQEVRVEPPVVQPDTGTDTEVVSEEESSSSEIQNSATEISTDSEFAHDDPTPTREIPSIVFNDVHVTKTRGTGGRGLGAPRKIQVTSGYIHRPSEKKKAPSTTPKQDIELKLSPLVPSAPMLRKPLSLLPRTEGYALNRTQSTGGIAAKVSLELKKRYLLGENNGPGSIQKSGSASTLDTKLRSFHSNISDCQKLLKPATEVSASMQTFCNKLDERLSPVVQPAQIFPETKTEVFENESEGRPRSPVHETSIIVPEIDWTKNNQTDDSLSTDSVSDGESHRKIPTIQIQIDENPPDSLIDIPKSVSEKKTLNQPKLLPDLEMKDILPEIHESLHVRQKSESSDSESIAEPVTSALTETELSDWARDGEVSDDLDDEFGESKDKNKTNVEEMKKTIITEALNSVLSKNLDNIEFMDTGTETSSEDGVADSQEGYTLLKTDEELAEDSLNPNINEIIEAKNDAVKNTGYCVIENFGSKVVDLKPSDLEKLKDKNSGDHDEDSLIIVETGTTTEDNTCSDSTVKNITEIKPLENNNFQRRRLEEKLAKLKAEMSSQKNVENSVEFDQHCQRLQSKIEFGNAKDSIDIRKSRRKSKDSPQKPDLIQEESSSPAQSPKVTLKLTPCIRTPDVLYNKELLEKERDVNQKLVQEMVMNKMKAENKSLERKKRRSRPFELSKCATTDVVSEINFNKEFETPSKRDSTYSSGSSVYATPDVLLSTLKFEDTFQTPMTSIKPEISDISSQPGARKALFNEDFKTPVAPPRLKAAEKLREDARLRAKMLSNEDLGLSPEDKFAKLKGKLVKKQDVADEDAIFRRCESFLYSNDTLNRKKSGSLKRSKSRDEDKPPLRTKSIGEIVDSPKPLEKICKSDPNLLDTDPKKNKKKGKDRERRKSITRMIATFFTKKSPMNSKGIFSRMSPKTKDVSKSCANLDLKDTDVVVEEPVRRKSFSETSTRRFENSSPPPIPPLPLNYSGNSIKGTDESSDGEHDWKRHDRSSCDTLDQSGVQDNSVSSVSGRKSKGAVKVARQAQRKRHRMAQEIQRKLEETEVKTRELEERGVVVEKALRGEDSNRYSRDESELLQEWFDLMRDRTELRRYERELMVRGQELELEDRHARLQHDLRERLDNNQQKTSEEVEIEGSIIKEMMEIVAKRDGLIALLEEDRLRYSNEDRDFEEQMLAKGLQLTPIRKPPEK